MFQRKTYKELYLCFLWQLCLFILTLNITASVFQAFEYTTQNVNNNKEDIIANFSQSFNISKEEISTLLLNLEQFSKETLVEEKMTFPQAFVLSLSLFYTIGWNQLNPSTSGGKIFAVIISCLGIPLTFIMLLTGGTIFTRHILDILRISQQDTSFNNQKHKYSETKIKTLSKKLLPPTIIVLLLLYILITAKILSTVENLDYHNALWYTFITLTTIGMDDHYRDRLLITGDIKDQIKIAVFKFFWVLFGMIIVVGCLMSIVTFTKQIEIRKTYRRHLKNHATRADRKKNNERLVHTENEEESSNEV